MLGKNVKPKPRPKPTSPCRNSSGPMTIEKHVVPPPSFHTTLRASPVSQNPPFRGHERVKHVICDIGSRDKVGTGV